MSRIFKPFSILIFSFTMICLLFSSAIAGGTGAEGVVVFVSILFAVFIGAPSVAAIFWLLMHLFPKRELKSQRSLTVRIIVDIMLILMLQLPLIFSYVARDSPAFLKVFYRSLADRGKTVNLAVAVTLFVALPPFGLILIYRLNKWVYSLPRWQRVFIHLPLSIMIALAVFLTGVMLLTTGKSL